MRTLKTKLMIGLLALAGLTSSCIDDIFLEGNGIRETEIRRATGFDEIASSGDFVVTVVPGNHYSVEVTAESNLLSYIETDVDGNTLKLRTRGLYSLMQNDPIEIHITMPELYGLTQSGSGSITTDFFQSKEFKMALSGSGTIDALISTDKLKAVVSGSGNIILEGDAYDSEFVISGSGKIKSYNLEQNRCQAAISGSGDMYVNASDLIDARISGSGKVFFINHPTVRSSVSGSGGVVEKN